MYSINKLKTWKSHDGGGYSCMLLRDGKAVAEVCNEGMGGCSIWHWLDSKQPKVTFIRYTGYDIPNPTQVAATGTPEEARLWAHILTLPDADYKWAEGHDSFVVRLTSVYELERKVKRKLKTGAMAIVNGQLMQWAAGTALPQHYIAIERRHPGARILNTMPLDEALALAVAAAIPHGD